MSDTCNYRIQLWEATPQLFHRLHHLQREGIFERFEISAKTDCLDVWARQEQFQYRDLVETMVKAEGCLFEF
jgi:hypothetical protein